MHTVVSTYYKVYTLFMTKKEKRISKKILIVLFLSILTIFTFMALYNNFMENSSISAYDVMKREQDIYNKEGYITYTKQTGIKDNKITYYGEIWSDTTSKMRKIISYDGKKVQRIDINGMDNSWSVDYAKKIYKKYNLEFINPEGRAWYLAVKGNPDFDLTPAKKLPIKKVWLGLRLAYFIPVNQNYYFYYDLFNYSLLRKENYKGTGENRQLESAYNFEEKMIPKTDQNMKAFLVSPLFQKDSRFANQHSKI